MRCSESGANSPVLRASCFEGGAWNATLVPKLPFARAGAGGTAQGRAGAKGYGRAGIFRAVESARGGLLVKSARRGDRASGRLHTAGGRAGRRQLGGA